MANFPPKMSIAGPESRNGWPQRQLPPHSIKDHCCFCPEPEIKESKAVASCLTLANNFQMDTLCRRNAGQCLTGKADDGEERN